MVPQSQAFPEVLAHVSEDVPLGFCLPCLAHNNNLTNGLPPNVRGAEEEN